MEERPKTNRAASRCKIRKLRVEAIEAEYGVH
jgi:hypothetical protein